jgi:hypothetical protein
MKHVAQRGCGDYRGDRKRQNMPDTPIERCNDAFGFPCAPRLGRSPIVFERDRAIRASHYHVGAAKTKIYKDDFRQPVAVRTIVPLFFSDSIEISEKAGISANGG